MSLVSVYKHVDKDNHLCSFIYFIKKNIDFPHIVKLFYASFEFDLLAVLPENSILENTWL